MLTTTPPAASKKKKALYQFFDSTLLSRSVMSLAQSQIIFDLPDKRSGYAVD